LVKSIKTTGRTISRLKAVFFLSGFASLIYQVVWRRLLTTYYSAGAVTSQALSLKKSGNVTVVEISTALIKNLMKIPFIKKELTDPGVNIITGDGRRYPMRTSRKFDLILMAPLRNTTSYSNNLHSREYFRLAARNGSPEKRSGLKAKLK